MPITLKVWAHWTDAPPGSGTSPLPPAPFPSSFSGYPVAGTVPKNAGKPNWPPGAATVNPVGVWCELVKQDDINLANWAGPGWPGQPPPSWQITPTPPSLGGDEGYDSLAVGFKVTEITLYHKPFVSDFVFTIQAPTGVAVATVNPPWGGTYKITLPVPIPDGKGIWTILIDRKPGSTVAAPNLLQGPGPVSEPYVNPYGSSEGELGIFFTGEVIPPCPTTKTLTLEVENPLGSGTFVSKQNATGKDCIDPGQKIRLTANYTPVPFSGITYDWDFGDTSSSATANNIQHTLHPTNSAEYVYIQPGSYIALVSLQIPNCPTAIPKPIDVCFPCPTLATLRPIIVAGQAPNNVVSFQFDVTWQGGTPPPNVAYIWTVTGPTGQWGRQTTTPTTDSNGTTIDGWNKLPSTVKGPLDVSQPGTYTVAVSAQVSPISSGCPIQDSGLFSILPSVTYPCPQVTIDPIQVAGCLPGAVTVQPFKINFSSPPPLSPSNIYFWKVTLPSGRNCQRTTNVPTTDVNTGWSGNGAASSGAVDLSETGTYVVTVTPQIPSLANCNLTSPPQAFQVSQCDIIPSTVASCSANAATGIVAVNFSEDVDATSATSPSNFSVTVNGAPQTLKASQLSYNPNTTTIGGLSFAEGNSISVTVKSVTDKAGNTIVANGMTNTCSTTAPENDGTGTTLCAGLLGAWLVMWIAAGVFWSWILTQPTPLSTTQWIIGLTLIATTVILFTAWILICRPSLCGILKWTFIANFCVMLIVGLLSLCFNPLLKPAAIVWVLVVAANLLAYVLRCQSCETLTLLTGLLTAAVAIFCGYYATATKLAQWLASLSWMPAQIKSILNFLSSCPPDPTLCGLVTSVWATALIFWLARRCWTALGPPKTTGQ